MSIIKMIKSWITKEKPVEVVTPAVEMVEVELKPEPTPPTPKPSARSVRVDGKWWVEINGHVRVCPSLTKHTAKQIRHTRGVVSIRHHGVNAKSYEYGQPPR
ncbi:hypothetical protein NVP1244A_103 [Vibrio phage 1.244.A._10N.261.54.C3]|nr:hypothetical protein NVP1244A_103 [Vibrio phage 1.244.A._10N.261.54.C3]AUR98731.1 hypothetical protein NVP1255O_103 [Vibrio phage 1.255.O._10N.286.45.F1]